MQEEIKMNVSSQSLFAFCCGNVSQMLVACYSVMKQLPSFLTITFAMYLCVLVCFWMEDFLTCYFMKWEKSQKKIITEVVPCRAISSWFIHQACEGSTGPEVLWCPSLLLEDSVWNNFYLQQTTKLLASFNKVPATQSVCERHVYKVYPCPWTCVVWSKVTEYEWPKFQK